MEVLIFLKVLLKQEVLKKNKIEGLTICPSISKNLFFILFKVKAHVLLKLHALV